jgi:hypothetical protein
MITSDLQVMKVKDLQNREFFFTRTFFSVYVDCFIVSFSKDWVKERGVRTAKKSQLLIDHFLPRAKNPNADYRHLLDLIKSFKNGTFCRLDKKEAHYFTCNFDWL